jgi:hypothetical protein
MRIAGLAMLAALSAAGAAGAADSNAVRPGIYELRPVHGAGRLCIGDGLRGVGDHFYKARDCSASEGQTQVGTRAFLTFAIVPHRFGGYVIRPASGFILSSTCMTLARGVVLGPPAINDMPCEMPGGATSRRDVGAPDQRFHISALRGGVYEIGASNGDCLDIRDSGGPGAELIAFECNRQPNQLFELVFKEPLRGEPRDWLVAEGWYETPTGMARGPALPAPPPPPGPPVIGPGARVAGAAPAPDKKSGKQ